MLPRNKSKLIIVPIAIILVISALFWWKNTHQPKLEYLRFDTLLETNQNGIISEIMPRPNSFFLVETSGRNQLTPKEMCVLESVAKNHPTNQVYLLLTSPIFQDKNFQVVKKKYGNLQAKYLRIPSLIYGSPISDLSWIEIIEDSKYSVSHLSDLLRYLILYNFGGTYLDLDALVIKPLPNLTNFLGRESYEYLNSAVLRFQKHHPILVKFLQYLKSNFNGQDWGANGPKLVTKVMQEFCRTPELSQMTTDTCLGIHVFDPQAFYPVPWKNWKDLYQTELGHNLTDSYSVHLWGRHSSHMQLEDLPEDAAIIKLAKTHCPISLQQTLMDEMNSTFDHETEPIENGPEETTYV